MPILISGNILICINRCLPFVSCFFALRFLTLPNSDHSTDIAILELWPAMTTWVRILSLGSFDHLGEILVVN